MTPYRHLLGKVFKDEWEGILWVVVDDNSCPEPQKKYAQDYNYEIFLYTAHSNFGGSAGFNPIKHLITYRPLLTRDELRMEAMLNPFNDVTTWGVELNYD